MSTNIEWTDETWNPLRARLLADPARVGWHCEHKSPGCEHCYAETLNRNRFGTGLAYKPGHRKDVETFLDDKALLKPLHWRKARRIFVCSMTDLFADFVTDEMIDRVFAVMALCPQHVFQVLTKRADRMREYFETPVLVDGDAVNRGREVDISAALKSVASAIGLGEFDAFDRNPFGGCRPGLPLPNVWLGVSVEDQTRADERIDILREIPSAVRFLSFEPLIAPLGEVDLSGIHWVICGGESGPGARPMHPDWARALRDQCAAADVPFFFKQWGAWLPGQNDPHPHMTEPPGYTQRRRVAHWQDGGWGPRPARANNYVMWEPDQTQHVGLRTGGNYFEVHCWAQRVGKKAAGRLLDGVAHDGMPA